MSQLHIIHSWFSRYKILTSYERRALEALGSVSPHDVSIPFTVMDTPISASRSELLFFHLPSSVLYNSTTFRGLWSSPTPPTTRICFPRTATAAPARGVGIGGKLIHRSPWKQRQAALFWQSSSSNSSVAVSLSFYDLEVKLMTN